MFEHLVTLDHVICWLREEKHVEEVPEDDGAAVVKMCWRILMTGSVNPSDTSYRTIQDPVLHRKCELAKLRLSRDQVDVIYNSKHGIQGYHNHFKPFAKAKPRRRIGSPSNISKPKKQDSPVDQSSSKSCEPEVFTEDNSLESSTENNVADRVQPAESAQETDGDRGNEDKEGHSPVPHSNAENLVPNAESAREESSFDENIAGPNESVAADPGVDESSCVSATPPDGHNEPTREDPHVGGNVDDDQIVPEASLHESTRPNQEQDQSNHSKSKSDSNISTSSPAGQGRSSEDVSRDDDPSMNAIKSEVKQELIDVKSEPKLSPVKPQKKLKPVEKQSCPDSAQTVRNKLSFKEYQNKKRSEEVRIVSENISKAMTIDTTVVSHPKPEIQTSSSSDVLREVTETLETRTIEKPTKTSKELDFEFKVKVKNYINRILMENYYKEGDDEKDKEKVIKIKDEEHFIEILRTFSRKFREEIKEAYEQMNGCLEGLERVNIGEYGIEHDIHKYFEDKPVITSETS